MPSIHLATEDALSEDVGNRLIAEFIPNFTIGLRIRRNGSGYLKSNIKKFCELARRDPLLLITDLDNETCSKALVSKWLASRAPPDGLIFRVAVREVEAWLLADHIGMQNLLSKGAKKLYSNTEDIADPKRFLLECARLAPRDVRSDLLVEKRAIASQGLGYNQRMGEFVRNVWDPSRASMHSDSLRRTINRMRAFAESS
jgi:hypothetical protein